jgi:flagellar P-ring protein precursor FlgI
LAIILVCPAQGSRLKDLVDIKGVRANQLVGYGLIIGLNKTGDGNSSTFTKTTIVNMLENMGVTVDPKSIKTGNAAAVMVTTELPPFSRQGNRLDVLVSSIGDAKSLQGGTLLLTPLRAPDGQVYAVAQGAISIGGFAEAAGGASVRRNHPTVGNVPGGAIVEREVPFRFNDLSELEFSLHNEDFSTAARVAAAINQHMGIDAARALDARTVTLEVPAAYQQNLVSLMAQIEMIEVVPDMSARVVVNERTGTIVMGHNVRINTVAISHGNLHIQIAATPIISQPNPLSNGQTVVTDQTDISWSEDLRPLTVIDSGTSIGDLVAALNAMGVSPRDLVAILQSIKAAGALQASLLIQ